MAGRLNIPEDGRPGIEAIAKFYDKLPLLKVVADELGPSQSTVLRISRALANRAEISFSDAQNIVTQIIGFHNLRSRLGMAADELYSAITESLASNFQEEWKKRFLPSWGKAKDNLIAVLGTDHPFYVIEKRTRLAYEHQNVLYDASIVTDIRPIFDDTGREIVQMSIHHVLSIEYFNGNSRAQLFAALDAADIAKLKKACERAQTKEATLMKKLKSFKGPIVLTGEVEDD